MKTRARTGKSIATALLLAAAMLLCLAGCDMGKHAAEEGRDAAQAQAEAAAQTWLEQAVPGAELLSAEPYVFHHLGVAPYQLTGLVSGTYRHDGREQAFWLDASNGDAWLEVDRETASALCALGVTATMEALGLSVDPDTLDAADGFAYFDIGTAEQIDALPAKYVLSGLPLEHLVQDPTHRPPLVVSFSCAVPDNEQLSRLTLSGVLRAQEECGLQLFNVQLTSQHETALLSFDRMTYQRLSDDGNPEYSREERLDAKSGEIVTNESA